MPSFFYGVVCYTLFLLSFLYLIGFVENAVVPKSIDSGPPGSLALAVPVNILLFGLFAVQHTIMARPRFKARLTQYLPVHAERSTFVLAASLLLLLLYWQWRPLPGVVWSVEPPAARAALFGVSLAGWALALYSSFLIDHFDLFGLRQVYLHLRRREYRHPSFKTPLLYRMVRNPLMLGILVGVWSTPLMTSGHLLFATLVTVYILIGVRFEERDLGVFLGEEYQRYRRRTPMLLPWPRRASRRGSPVARSSEAL